MKTTSRSILRPGRRTALVAVMLASLLLATAASAHECRDQGCDWVPFPINCLGYCDLSVDMKLDGYLPGFDVGLANCALYESDPGAPDGLGERLLSSATFLEAGDADAFRCLDISNLLEGDYLLRAEIYDSRYLFIRERTVPLDLDKDWGLTVVFAQQSEDPEPLLLPFLSFSPNTPIGFLYVSGLSGGSDADSDGVAATVDRCPETTALAEVDEFGCSQAQFCSSQPATTVEEGWECRQADWRNDEPGMRGSDRDCEVGYLPDGSRVCVMSAVDSTIEPGDQP